MDAWCCSESWCPPETDQRNRRTEESTSAKELGLTEVGRSLAGDELKRSSEEVTETPLNDDDSFDDVFLEFPQHGGLISTPEQITELDAPSACIMYSISKQAGNTLRWEEAFQTLAVNPSLAHLRLFPVEIPAENAEASTPDFSKAFSRDRPLTSFSMLGTYTESMIANCIQGLGTQTELKYLHLSTKALFVPEGLINMLEQGHFRELRYLAMKAKNIKLEVEKWKLPRLEQLALACGSLQGDLNIGRLTSLNSVDVSGKETVVVSFGAARNRVRRLTLRGNVAIDGNVERVAYLRLKGHPQPNAVIRACPQLLELAITGLGDYDAIFIPTTLKLLALSMITVQELRTAPGVVLEVLCLLGVTTGQPIQVNARNVYLEGSVFEFFSQFSLCSASLGSPHSLALVSPLAGFRGDVVATLLQSEVIRKQLRVLITDAPLRSRLPDIPHLTFLGLNAYLDIHHVPMEHRALKGLAISNDDTHFFEVNDRISSLCEELWVDVKPTSDAQSYAIKETRVHWHCFDVWLQQIAYPPKLVDLRSFMSLW